MKPARFVGDSRAAGRRFPDDARSAAGYELEKVQRGEQPADFKPMPAIGRGVEELRVWDTSGTYRVIYLARRFAAKEAFAKAWGTGMTPQLDWRDVQVLNEANGRPILSFCKDLREAVYSTRRHFNVTISDNDDNVIAFVTMEAA